MEMGSTKKKEATMEMRRGRDTAMPIVEGDRLAREGARETGVGL